MTQSQIEQAKLTAGFLNSLTSGTILAAIVAPISAGGLEVLMPDLLFWLWAPSLLLIAAAVALGAEYLGRRRRHRHTPAE